MAGLFGAILQKITVRLQMLSTVINDQSYLGNYYGNRSVMVSILMSIIHILLPVLFPEALPILF